MINRIVRMTFAPEQTGNFRKIFEESKEQIASFPGCCGLKLLQDTAEQNVFYTYSLWADEQSLEAYRKSELFGSVWPSTKALFSAKPMAWSTLVIDEVK